MIQLGEPVVCGRIVRASLEPNWIYEDAEWFVTDWTFRQSARVETLGAARRGLKTPPRILRDARIRLEETFKTKARWMLALRESDWPGNLAMREWIDDRNSLVCCVDFARYLCEHFKHVVILDLPAYECQLSVAIVLAVIQLKL